MTWNLHTFFAVLFTATIVFTTMSTVPAEACNPRYQRC
ncbi:hypothetical protein FIV06_16700 [Labrenzia sp. THAF191b]|nr:hypothetical protein FIV06_16700 [Labrenzia sp. THAF191b]QFT05386.1 hypothetical protein FIV05_16695 [Labrenzia sp. THAF191a]QFT16930.1 hypothetical protein FIV03_16710 [Labrenzia sp. THAF187b]